MKGLMLGLVSVVGLAWLVVPAGDLQAQDCWLCVNYPGTGGSWHFWPDWGGGVCPDEEGQNNCQIKPVGEDTGMPGYSGKCPEPGCPPMEEEEQQLLVTAVLEKDAAFLVKLLVERPSHVTFDAIGRAIQVTECDGSVVESFALAHDVVEVIKAELMPLALTVRMEKGQESTF